MKYFFTIALCIILVTAKAQEFRYGFGIAPQRSWWVPDPDLYEVPEKLSGFQYGILVEQTFFKGGFISVQAGFNLNYTQGIMTSVKSEQQGKIKEWTVRAQYLELPVSLKLRTPQFGPFTIYGLGGIAIGTCVRAHGDFTENGIRLDSDIDYLAGDNPNGINYNRPNQSIIYEFGTEIAITETASVQLGFFMQNGLADAVSDNNESSDIPLKLAGIHIAGLF